MSQFEIDVLEDDVEPRAEAEGVAAMLASGKSVAVVGLLINRWTITLC